MQNTAAFGHTAAMSSSLSGTQFESLIEAIATSCRDGMIKRDWVNEVPIGRRANEPWMDDLKNMVVQKISLEAKFSHGMWRQMFESVKPTLKKKYPHECSAIEATITKYLRKSPVEEILRSRAYRWLQYCEKRYIVKQQSPLGPSGWYPALAVEVAHEVFRCKGKLKTLKKYLRKPARLRNLESIRCHLVEGMSC